MRKISSYPAPKRLGIFILTLLLIWLPLAAPLSWLLRHDANLLTIVTMGLLFGEFLILLPVWGKLVHGQNQIFRYYGFTLTQTNRLQLHRGLTIGLLATFALFVLEGSLGWLQFQAPPNYLPRIVWEGLLSGLGVALAEELFFRGWLLDELQRDYSPQKVVWLNGIIFAFLHFLQPPTQMLANALAFPGLALMGMTLVWAKYRGRGLLGLPIGIHGGMVWAFYILDMGRLYQYKGEAPAWVTTVNGHPFAGIIGILALVLLAMGLRVNYEK